MKKIFLQISLIIFISSASAADLKDLRGIFKSNYNNFYTPRMCGMNIGRLIKEAEVRKIDLSNSYVLKVEGSGFLETSGFFSRGNVNERAMLGYFHFVLIADDYVFDFDLDEPLILKLNDYIRLQFTPPYLPFYVFGIEFDPIKQLRDWKLSAFEISSFLTNTPKLLWTKSLGDFINLKVVLENERIR